MTSNRFHLSRLASLLAAAIVAGLMLASVAPAEATTGVLNTFSNDQTDDIRPICDTDATTGQTFATTSYADVTLATCTFTPRRNDPTGAGLQASGLSTSTTAYADLIEVSYSVDGIKATATTGTCGAFVNGALVALSARTLGGVVNGSLSWHGYILNTVVGAQTVKLQCKSGDTNAFTVNFAHLLVNEVIRTPLRN